MQKGFALLALITAACGGGSDELPSLVAGTRALGPEVVATAAGRVTLPAERAVAEKALAMLAVKRRAGEPFIAPLVDAAWDANGRAVTVTVEEPLTAQLVAPGVAEGAPARTWRAIAGVSMGGGAAAAIGLRAPEKWDLVADLGGEPGPSTRYSLAMIAEFLVGGFAEQRPPLAGTYELTSDFEHFVYQSGGGVGLTLDRRLYMKATRDLSRALGNPALYNPESPYWPPGVTAEWAARVDRCTAPIVLSRFHDQGQNPDGSLPVITFCDGGDGARLGLGVFDPQVAQTDAPEVLLAVDRNGNGRRDAGEPVLVQPAEPFRDVGADGLASRDEPGYDATTNPDPAGDDWHPTRNPLGAEGNVVRDPGEPFEDVGLDGVAGTCQAPATGCWDHGEGDGVWTVNPSLARWLANDAGAAYRNMDDATRRRIAFYADAGIRDFLNSHVATATAIGEIAALGLPVAMWNGFPRLGGVASESLYDFEKVPWRDIAANVFVRYGDPAASPAQIEVGDGRHVGSPPQLIARLTTLFAWIDARWQGDRARAEVSADSFLRDQRFTSPSTGRENPYAVYLPPGYSTSAVTYPVVYMLHGYGMAPDDLLGPVGLLSTYMAEGRMGKMIIVFVDGRCRNGDGCETGTFFMDSPASSQAQMETHLYELRSEIDRRFRVR